MVSTFSIRNPATEALQRWDSPNRYSHSSEELPGDQQNRQRAYTMKRRVSAGKVDKKVSSAMKVSCVVIIIIP